jgi:hypothetical protein
MPALELILKFESYSRWDFLYGRLARRKAPRYLRRTKAQMCALNGIPTHDPSVRAKTFHALDRAAPVNYLLCTLVSF